MRQRLEPATTRDTCEVHPIDAEAVERAREAIPEERAVQRVAETFGALADVTRARILFALAGRELCTCDLAALLGVSPPAVSHHLRVLRNLRLVRSRRDGKVVYYTLDDRHVEQWLEECLEHVSEE